MSEGPLVSVVIPTYNRPDLLVEAVESVLAQTYRDFELVIINDGSTDDTLDRLAPYAGRARVITQPNGGIVVARNRGIDESRGKYVALLDHDDWWLPRKLETQVAFLESHPECVAAAVPYSHSSAPNEPAVRKALIVDDRGVVRRPIKALADGMPFMQTCTLMVDRGRAQGLRYGTVRGAIEDMQFQIGLLLRGPIGIAGEEILAVWRVHESNFSSNAGYYYEGHRLLRKMARRGEFGEMDAQSRDDLAAYLAVAGRITAVKQLVDGLRWRALRVYLGDFVHQARHGRLAFLASFPFLLAMPSRLAARVMSRR